MEFRHCYVAWGANGHLSQNGSEHVYFLCNVSGSFRIPLPIRGFHGIAPNNDYVGRKVQFLQNNDPRFQFYDEDVYFNFKEHHEINFNVPANGQEAFLESTLEWIGDNLHNPWCFEIGRVMPVKATDALTYRFAFSDIQDAVLFRLKF